MWCLWARIVVVQNDKSIWISFSQSTENFWQTNGRIPCRIHGILIFEGQSCHMTEFRNETHNHLLCNPNSWLAFSFWFIRIYPRLVNCYDVVNSFGSTSGELYKHFMTRASAPSNVHARSNVCWSHECLGILQFHDKSYDDLLQSIFGQHRCFLAQQLILDDLRVARLSMMFGHVCILWTNYTRPPGMMLHHQNLI